MDKVRYDFLRGSGFGILGEFESRVFIFVFFRDVLVRYGVFGIVVCVFFGR